MTDQPQPAQEEALDLPYPRVVERGRYVKAEELARLQADLEQCQRERDRYRAVLAKIARSGNVHRSWLINDARDALAPDPSGARGEQKKMG